VPPVTKVRLVTKESKAERASEVFQALTVNEVDKASQVLQAKTETSADEATMVKLVNQVSKEIWAMLVTRVLQVFQVPRVLVASPAEPPTVYQDDQVNAVLEVPMVSQASKADQATLKLVCEVIQVLQVFPASRVSRVTLVNQDPNLCQAQLATLA